MPRAAGSSSLECTGICRVHATHGSAAHTQARAQVDVQRQQRFAACSILQLARDARTAPRWPSSSLQCSDQVEQAGARGNDAEERFVNRIFLLQAQALDFATFHIKNTATVIDNGVLKKFY